MNDPSNNIPTSETTAEGWINWHKSLKTWFSKKDANEYWVRFWEQRAGAGTQADGQELRTYLRTQGVELTTDWSGSMTDSISGIADWFGDTFTMIRNIFFGAVILVIAIIAYFLISNIRKGKSIGEMAIGINPTGGLSKVTALKTIKKLA